MPCLYSIFPGGWLAYNAAVVIVVVFVIVNVVAVFVVVVFVIDNVVVVVVIPKTYIGKVFVVVAGGIQ